MSLYARLRFPDYGYQIDQENVKSAGLELNECYPIDSLQIGQSHTSIKLKGYPYNFNSVHFIFENEDGTLHNIFEDPELNPYLSLR